MKQITLFALLFLSLNSWSQKTMAPFERSHESPTYNGIEIYSDISKLKSSLLSIRGNNLVSHKDNKLVISSNSFGVLSTLVFKSNPVSGVVYYFSRTITKGISSAMTPMETYVYQVGEIVSRSGFKPYDENSDPDNGEIYSKWLFSTGFLIVKLNHENNLVVQSERVYDQDITDFINSLEVKQ
jgi:hypothetical protein